MRSLESSVMRSFFVMLFKKEMKNFILVIIYIKNKDISKGFCINPFYSGAFPRNHCTCLSFYYLQLR